jgi:hypothetical protein
MPDGRRSYAAAAAQPDVVMTTSARAVQRFVRIQRRMANARATSCAKAASPNIGQSVLARSSHAETPHTFATTHNAPDLLIPELKEGEDISVGVGDFETPQSIVDEGQLLHERHTALAELVEE